MSTPSERIRASHDGNTFHVLWAGRRALELLSPTSDLVAVVVEGPSPREGAERSVETGEEVIDVAEYRGSEVLAEATRIDYIQLKHSTLRETEVWTASDLATTLKGWGARLPKLAAARDVAALLGRMRFRFVSNRPIATSVLDSVADLASGAAPRHPKAAEALTKATGLPEPFIRPFFDRLDVSGREAGFRVQKQLLDAELREIVVDPEDEPALRIKNLFYDKLGSGPADNVVRKSDLELALNIGPEDLLPAEVRIDDLPHAVAREQEEDLQARILAASAPLIITADGGVGKSIVATRLHLGLPKGSAWVLYDCYGGGDYRREPHERHAYRVALTQMANTLAVQGLCMPLLPRRANDALILAAFLKRLRAAVRHLQASEPDALLLLVVDAADNAMMGAKGSAERAFVPGLLQADLPAGVRLVMLCRPDRLDLLKAPAGLDTVPLRPFSLAETGRHLRARHPDASDADVVEFDRRTSSNPRVQANAFTASTTLAGVLRALGPKPQTVSAIIAGQLEGALDKVRNEAEDPGAIDELCKGLATLRPLIPIETLARLAAVDASAVRSFAHDFGDGRWLLTAGDGVQFRDEPVEDWFRNRYAATPEAMARFADRLAPLADGSAYVAAALPGLWLQAERPDRLTTLALSTERLPSGSPLERREIDAMRVQFALRAALKAGRMPDAARLALKAGEVAAGSGLQDKLLRDETDLFGVALDVPRLQDIGARRMLGRWVGSRYAAEAAVFSQKPELEGDARSRLRSAEDLLDAWSRAGPTEQGKKPYDTRERADFAFAFLNLEGPLRAVQEITRWRPKEIWFETAHALADRLIDHGRAEEARVMAELAMTRAPALAAGVCFALGSLDLPLPPAVIKALLARRTEPRPSDPGRRTVWDRSPAVVVKLVEGALRSGGFDPDTLARRLDKVLPPHRPRTLASRLVDERTRYLRARTLRDALRGTPTAFESLKPEPRRRGKPSHLVDPDPYEDRELRVRAGAVLPWWNARAQVLAAAPVSATQLDHLIAEATRGMNAAVARHSNDVEEVQDEIVEIWHDLLVESGHATPDRLGALDSWIGALRRPLYLPTWRKLARKSGCRPELADRAVRYARRAGANEWNSAAVAARDQIETHVAATRALLEANRPEALAHLDQAVEVAGLLGDEVPTRWAALLALATRAGPVSGACAPETAWRLARAAEFAAGYIEDQFDWSGTVSALTAIHPPSAAAAVSRWRDRSVGETSSLLVLLEENLRKAGALDPVAGLALLGFEGDWPVAEMFEAALIAEPPLAKEIVDAVSRHAIRARFSPGARQTLADVARRHGLDARAFGRAGRSPAISRRVETRRRRADPWLRDLSRALADHAPRTYADAAALLTDLKTRHRYVSPGCAWGVILAAVPAASLPEVIETLLATDELRPSLLADVLDSLPEPAREALAVRNAVQRSVLARARRDCWSIRGWGGYGDVIEDLAAASGLPPGAIAGAVLDGVAEDVRGADSEDLFNLLPLMAPELSPADAQAALEFGLCQFENVMPPGFGDGPFDPLTAPSSDPDMAVAGLIAVALAAPAYRVRWQAAHAARTVLTLGRTGVVTALASFVASGKAEGFAAPGLPYYALNAELWFHIVVARVAGDRPNRAAALEPRLQATAQPTNDHVLLRGFAADGLLSLHAAGEIVLSPGRIAELQRLNTPSKPSKSTERIGGRDWYSESRRPSRRFSFSYEQAKGSAGRLASAFGLSPDQLERKAETVIFRTWKSSYDHKAKDPRAGDPAWSDADSRGGYHGFREYLGYHALFCIAGQLVRTTPPLRYPGASRDEFADWLAGFQLTQLDGSWTSDRLDLAPPLPALPSLEEEEDRAFWPWSVQLAELDGVLRHADEIVVAGDWHQWRGQAEQDVAVSSVLVSPATSAALLAACQTIENPWEYHLPSEDDAKIDAPPYRQKAWINDHRPEPRLDRSDPWIGAMSSSSPRPASWLVRRLRLRPTGLERAWRSAARGRPLFRAEIWAGATSRRSETLPPHGQRLLIPAARLPRLLQRFDMDLLVHVQIRRTLRSDHDESRWDRTPSPPYFRLFLFRKDGSLETL
ncbi:hypothetical protein [Brevundimonas phoenicis]|uniref:hypothetical protein n=1 Tax=Brevundimonas sp. 2P06AC TaxID=3132274 RepID=UPI0039A61DE4